MKPEDIESTTEAEENISSFTIPMASHNLFGEAFSTGVLNALALKDEPKDAPVLDSGGSNISDPTCETRIMHPVCVDAVLKLKDISTHHCACIQVKKFATVGLGFIDKGDDVKKTSSTQEATQAVASLLSGQAYVRSKVDEALDPLTTFGFLNELMDAEEDFEDLGTGYLEVVRDSSGKIVWIEHLSMKYTWAVKKENHLYYYCYNPVSGNAKYYALFGKKNKEWLMNEGPYKGSNIAPEKISEVIPFILPSNRTKYQGYPDWISASTDIDMLSKAKQYKTDFYHNRGVLDYIVSVTGAPMDGVAWKALVKNIKATNGAGNNFKNLALNLGHPDAKLEVHKLAMGESTENQFASDNETLTQNIVSAHRVPQLLANILIPGKLGASNEFINALMGFQLLTVGPRQNIIQSMLGKTLGGPDGVDGLEEQDFRLRIITSQIDLQAADTMSKMTTEVTDPANAGRDLTDGVKT